MKLNYIRITGIHLYVLYRTRSFYESTYKAKNQIMSNTHT